MALSADQKKFYENTLSVTEARDRGARRRDPGGARQSEGSSGRAAERAEGGAADVRRGLSAPRRPQRAGRGRIPGLNRGLRRGRRRPRPAAGFLLRRASSRPSPPSPVPRRLRASEGGRRRRAPLRGARALVTLAPNLTEIVFALGAGDRLVGVSEFSDYPEAARALPRVGGLEVDAEKVAALSPDLVLAVAEGNARGAVRALEAAGLPVAVAPSGSLDAVLDAIRLVGQRLGRREPRRSNSARSLAASARPCAIGCPAASGRGRSCSSGRTRRRPPEAGTFLDDLLREAGAENLAGAAQRLARAVGGIPRDRAGRPGRRAATRPRPGKPTSGRSPRARCREVPSPAPASCPWTSRP